MRNVIAREYGFPSWDALRAHVEQVQGTIASDSNRSKRRGLVYYDPVPDVILLRGPLTRDAARQLADQRVSGVKVDSVFLAVRRAPGRLRHRHRAQRLQKDYS
jgi:hypothetical protein